MAEADKYSIGELKRRAVGVLESMGYRVERDLILDKGIWSTGAIVRDTGTVVIDYLHTPEQIKLQLDFRDRAKSKGVQVEDDSEKCMERAQKHVDDWQRILDRL